MATPNVQKVPTRESVCAVVPTYNRKKDVAACVDALLRQTRPLDEIILVDNASTDGTGELMARRFGGRVNCVRLPENRGGAGGFHEGMKLAYQRGHDWIWCLDSDAVPLADTLQKLCEADYPNGIPVVAKTCPAHEPTTGEEYPNGALLDLKLRRTVPLDPKSWQGKILPVDLAHFCCLLVRSDAAYKAEFGEPGIFIWFDDLIFSLAIRKLGRILHVGTTSLIHPSDTARLRPIERHGRLRPSVEVYWKQYYLFRNSFLFRSRCFGKWRTLFEHTDEYIRMMARVAMFDDFKFYRMRILTKAFVDAILGRLGKGVDPEGFVQKRPAFPAPTREPARNV